MKRRDQGDRRDQDHVWEVALKILRYLDNNSKAADTVEGILEWWLPKQSMYEEKRVVEQALERMVSRSFLLAMQSSDARKHYRLNADRIDEIRCLIRQGKDDDQS
jgi:hypothetical protein